MKTVNLYLEESEHRELTQLKEELGGLSWKELFDQGVEKLKIAYADFRPRTEYTRIEQNTLRAPGELS